MTIGITGGIGSGKSYISAILREKFGIPVYDCDKEAKRLTASNEEIRQKLISLVGPEVFDAETLNKQLLADYLFADVENASQVNAIIHPVVLEDFKKWQKEQRDKSMVGLESAILFESGFNEAADYVLFVDAPEEVRLRRAMLRDTASEAQIRSRMGMQQPELHRHQADFIIVNDTPDDTKLQEQLAAALRKIENN
ncbi:MAG: dephospho-CoA kinase [Bacteroidaceae bacterium]|nr:dephospho-CoA kinase [Bacteroidaceae bacterium]MBQ9170748.1 dephospho-CoA kinase [Bacteroidaceae bacterium]